MNRGFYKGADRSSTDCIKWDILKRYGRKDMLPFWIADSDYRTCRGIVKSIVKRAKRGTFGYSYINDEYRGIVCKWMKERNGFTIAPEDIIITPGVMSGIFFLIKLFTEEGDNVVVSTPVYNPFYRVIEKNNRNILRNPLTETGTGNEFTYRIDFADLEVKLSKAKMFILCSPHNPVGRVWTEEELQKILKLCRKYNCFLISDEIHGDIIMEKGKFFSMGHYLHDYDKMAVCTAPSKTFNIAGLNHSNLLIVNKEIREKLQTTLRNYSVGSPNAFGIVACRSAYLKGAKWADRQNLYIRDNYRLARDFFHRFFPEYRICLLEGTYLMWVDLSKLKVSQDELIDGLAREGVLINSGTIYGEDYTGYIRINLACGRKQLLKGLSRIGNYLNKFSTGKGKTSICE